MQQSQKNHLPKPLPDGWFIMLSLSIKHAPIYVTTAPTLKVFVLVSMLVFTLVKTLASGSDEDWDAVSALYLALSLSFFASSGFSFLIVCCVRPSIKLGFPILFRILKFTSPNTNFIFFCFHLFFNKRFIVFTISQGITSSDHLTI